MISLLWHEKTPKIFRASGAMASGGACGGLPKSPFTGHQPLGDPDSSRGSPGMMPSEMILDV